MIVIEFVDSTHPPLSTLSFEPLNNQQIAAKTNFATTFTKYNSNASINLCYLLTLYKHTLSSSIAYSGTSISLIPSAVIWNFPSDSGRQGESTTFATRSVALPFLRASLFPFHISAARILEKHQRKSKEKD